MRQRDKAGGKAVKTKRRKTLRGRNAPPAARSRISTDANPDKKIALLTRERDEALERETATSEVLRIISNSPTDLQSALGAIAESAARLLDVAGAEISRVEGGGLRLMAKHGAFPQRPVGSIRPINRDWVTGRAVIDRTTVQVLDLQAAESEFPEGAASARQYGHRTTLATPLLREGTPIGAILIRRMEVRPFTDKQIALLQNFAAQAVIAIENTRLLNELRESLQQQTATADVLKVISSSPGELEPVFNTMLENATRICEAQLGVLMMFEDGAFHYVTSHGVTPAYAEAMRRDPVFHPSAGHPLDRLASTKQVIHIPDVRVEQGMRGRLVELAGARTLLSVPMLKDNKLVGTIAIYRQEVRPFTEKQIELVKNFAAQAVIAIENTRLLNELRESLQQQTATADVLKVISRSTFDLNTVLYALSKSAKRLCMSDQAYFYLLEGKSYRLAASCGFSPQAEALLKQHTIVPGRNTLVARTSLEGRVVHIEDVLADPEYTYSEAQKLIGFRTLLGVPLLREGTPIGVMTLSRCTVQPFTQKQIDLVSTFADQAVIAIENVRLFDEVQARTRDLTKSLEQQTATSEILEVISNSPTDTQPAFDAIVRSGLNLFPDAVVAISLPDRDLVKLAAIGGADEAGVEALRGRYPMPLSHEFITGTAILDRREIDLADAHEPPKDLTVGAQNLLAGGYRAMTVMPMMRGDETIGALNVIRRHPGPLSDKQRELLRTFANQAVIAIENTRLFNELRQRTNDLVSRWNNRPQRPKCCRSSANRPVSWSLCSRRCWKMRCEFAMPNSAVLVLFEGNAFRASCPA